MELEKFSECISMSEDIAISVKEKRMKDCQCYPSTTSGPNGNCLRRHPHGHFLLPHSASEDVELSGYLIPKGSEMLFNNVQLRLDEEVWGPDVTEFRPERFLEWRDENGEMVDLKGTSEIKLMSFGVGRKMCLAYMLAILYLEYSVANLVREFEWEALGRVDMTKIASFTNVMKNPVRIEISLGGRNELVLGEVFGLDV